MTPAREEERGNVSIDSDVQLLVEGAHLRHFVSALLKDLSRDDVEIQNFGGVNDLRLFLVGFVQSPNFRRVTRFGIVRDAEASAASALQSVQDACRSVGLAAPQRVNEPQGQNPSVRCWILPDGQRAGMLETLLWETVAESSEGRCVEEFLTCVERIGRGGVARPDKARSYAWIATRPRPEVSVGIAAKKGYWNLQHQALDGLRGFLSAL